MAFWNIQLRVNGTALGKMGIAHFPRILRYLHLQAVGRSSHMGRKMWGKQMSWVWGFWKMWTYPKNYQQLPKAPPKGDLTYAVKQFLASESAQATLLCIYEPLHMISWLTNSRNLNHPIGPWEDLWDNVEAYGDTTVSIYLKNILI